MAVNTELLLIDNVEKDKWDVLMQLAEGGSSGSAGVLVVNTTSAEGGELVMNKTWQEIHDAMANGTIVINLFNDEDGYPMHSFIYNAYRNTVDTNYYVSNHNFEDGEDQSYIASSPDDYPAYDEAS